MLLKELTYFITCVDFTLIFRYFLILWVKNSSHHGLQNVMIAKGIYLVGKERAFRYRFGISIKVLNHKLSTPSTLLSRTKKKRINREGED